MPLNATLGPDGWTVEPLTRTSGTDMATAISTADAVAIHGNAKRGAALLNFPRSSADHGTVTGPSGNTPTVVYTTRDNIPVMRVTTVAGFFGTINLTPFSKAIPMGRLSMLVYVSDPSTLSAFSIYLGTESGFTNYMTAGLAMGSTGRDNGSAGFPGWYLVTYDPPATGTYAGLSADVQQRRWNVGGGTPDFATSTFTHCYIRPVGQTGVTGTIELAGVWVNEYSTAPSIVLTADDGYTSWYELGLPIAEKYGLRMSQGVIGYLSSGNPNYVSVANLKSAVARGHECYTHGDPSPSFNLAQYTTPQEVAADILTNKAFVKNNGLARNGSENLYAYPQGVFQHSRTSTVIQQGLDLAGITHARTATGGNGAGILVNRHTAKMKRYMPIIGHTWSNADEAGNISRLVLRIQQAAAQGRSVMLMTHKFVTGTPTTGIEISTADWTTICAAIHVEIEAGRMKNPLWSEFAAEIDAAAV